MPHGKSG